MAMIFHLSMILILALARGDNVLRETNSDDNSNSEKDVVAYESVGAPMYGASNAIPFPGLPLNGKSAYSYPVPGAISTLPASYGAYVTNLGLSNPYAYGSYNRYNFSPYTVPSLYGASLQNSLGYGSAAVPGYGSAAVPGYGYTGYGSPFYGRSAYPGDGYAYSGYAAGLGSRYSGLGYGSTALRAGLVARSAVPVASVPAPVAAFSAPVNALPAPLPAVSPYRPVVRPLQSKDGSARYFYAPDGQAYPAY